MKNWKKSAKKGAMKIGNLFLKISLLMAIISVMAYYTGILSGIIGGIMAYYLSILGKLSLELTILAVILASLSLFLMGHQYFKENGLSYSLIDHRHSEENENNNPIAPSAE